MLDHHHAVPGLDQPVELHQQAVDILRMQPVGGFVEHIQGRPTGHPLQLGGQFDPLRLATGELGRRLPQAQVAQADILQHLQATPRRRLLGEHR